MADTNSLTLMLAIDRDGFYMGRAVHLDVADEFDPEDWQPTAQDGSLIYWVRADIEVGVPGLVAIPTVKVSAEAPNAD